MFKLAVRYTRFLILACAALIGPGAFPTAAQTYDFTFSGGGVSIPNGVLTFIPSTGGYSASGTVSGWTGAAAIANGQIVGIYQGGYFFTDPTDYAISTEFQLSNGNLDDIYISINPIEGIGDNISAWTPGNQAELGQIMGGTSTFVQASPAPIPGEGILSYVVFGLVALLVLGRDFRIRFVAIWGRWHPAIQRMGKQVDV